MYALTLIRQTDSFYNPRSDTQKTEPCQEVTQFIHSDVGGKHAESNLVALEGFEHLSSHAYGTLFPGWTRTDPAAADSKIKFVSIERTVE